MRRRTLMLLLLGLIAGCGYGEEAVREGHTTSEWIATVEESPDKSMRLLAIDILGDMGPDEASRTLRTLQAAVKDPDPEIRLHALRAIAKLGPKARGASTTVMMAMRDRNRVVAKEATKVNALLTREMVKDLLPKPAPPPQP